MLGINVAAAETDAEARYLFSSLQQSFLNMRSGRPGRLPPPVEDFDARLDPYARAMLEDSLACAIVGGAATVRDGLEAFVRRTGADELMVTANIFDHDKRKRSFEIVAEAAECDPHPQGMTPGRSEFRHQRRKLIGALAPALDESPSSRAPRDRRRSNAARGRCSASCRLHPRTSGSPS